jgi:predicted Fe-Mo cluster-binding NifX family protein
MKIALPTSDSGMIEAHFGHCSGFTLYHVENNSISGEERIIPPAGCGCKSSIIPDLAAQGVTVMLAGNMGPGAAALIQDNGMELYRGVSGPAQAAVETFLAGKIADQDQGCGDGAGDHDCGHHA